jgi:hypothetical protein
MKKFIRHLGPSLERKYGRKSAYSPEEIRRTAGESGLLNEWIPYALVMYGTYEACQALAADYTGLSYPTAVGVTVEGAEIDYPVQ